MTTILYLVPGVALCGWLIMRLCRDTAEIAFELPLYTIETSTCGEIRDLKIVLGNRSRNRVRVVGAGEICGEAGCNRVRGLPVELPAGGAAVMHVEFHARAHPGVGVNEIPFYLDAPDVPMVMLRVRCVVRAPDDTRKPPRRPNHAATSPNGDSASTTKIH